MDVLRSKDKVTHLTRLKCLSSSTNSLSFFSSSTVSVLPAAIEVDSRREARALAASVAAGRVGRADLAEAWAGASAEMGGEVRSGEVPVRGKGERGQ